MIDCPEAHSETCQTSKVERFAKIVHGFSSLTIFARNSILDVWHCSINASKFSPLTQSLLTRICQDILANFLDVNTLHRLITPLSFIQVYHITLGKMWEVLYWEHNSKSQQENNK